MEEPAISAEIRRLVTAWRTGAARVSALVESQPLELPPAVVFSHTAAGGLGAPGPDADRAPADRREVPGGTR